MSRRLDLAIKPLHPNQLFPDVLDKYRTMRRRANRAIAFMDSLIRFNDFEGCSQHLLTIIGELILNKNFENILKGILLNVWGTM